MLSSLISNDVLAWLNKWLTRSLFLHQRNDIGRAIKQSHVIVSRKISSSFDLHACEHCHQNSKIKMFLIAATFRALPFDWESWTTFSLDLKFVFESLKLQHAEFLQCSKYSWSRRSCTGDKLSEKWKKFDLWKTSHSLHAPKFRYITLVLFSSHCVVQLRPIRGWCVPTLVIDWVERVSKYA